MLLVKGAFQIAARASSSSASVVDCIVCRAVVHQGKWLSSPEEFNRKSIKVTRQLVVAPPAYIVATVKAKPGSNASKRLTNVLAAAGTFIEAGHNV